MKKLLCFFLLCLQTLTFAQNKTVKGKVTFDELALPDVDVQLESENHHYTTKTDNNGHFVITINDDIEQYTLRWSYPDFESEYKELTYVEQQYLQLTFSKILENELDVLVIDDTRQAIKQYADKKVINVENITALNQGSVFEAIEKTPGVIITTTGQVGHNGKLATIFLDDEPTGMSGDQLVNFLKSLPASSIKSIEVIDNPGAKYSATYSGTIINIITKQAKIAGISGSISHRTTINDNIKKNSTAQLLFKKNKFSWNFTTGYTNSQSTSEKENAYAYQFEENEISNHEIFENNNWFQSYFLRNKWQYRINDKATFNIQYNYSHFYGKPSSNGRFTQTINDETVIGNQKTFNKNHSNRHSLGLTYNQQLDTLGARLTVNSNTNWNSRDNSNTLWYQDEFLSEIQYRSNHVYSRNRLDFETPFSIVKGTFSAGSHYTTSTTNNQGDYTWSDDREYIPYTFEYNNFANYVSVSSRLGQFMASAGLRHENLTYETITQTDSLNLKKNYNGFFPTISLKYPIIFKGYFSLGYNKRMSLPSTDQFNPNVFQHNSAFLSAAGNPNIEPELSHNLSAELTFFDYIYVRYGYSILPKQNYSLYEITNNGLLESKNFSFNDVKSHHFSIGLPIPYMVFTKSLGEIFENANQFEIDKISFTYVNFSYSRNRYKEIVPEKFEKPNITLYTYSQFYLGNDTRLFINYYRMFKGVTSLYELNKPIEGLSVSLNKKFADNKWSVNLGVDNLLNNQGHDVNVFGNGIDLRDISRAEKRMFTIGVTYNFGSFKDESQNNFPQSNPTNLIN